MGVVSGIGSRPEGFFDGLADGVLAIEPAPWSVPDRQAWWAPVRDFVPGDWMSDKVAEGTDRYAQFCLAATAQAVAQSGLTAFDPFRTAITHGTTMGGFDTLQGAQHMFERGGAGAVSAKTLIKALPNMAAAQIAMRWGIRGEQTTICTACASSLDAVGLACRLIEAGEADVVIAGGSEAGIGWRDRADGSDYVPAFMAAQTQYRMTAAGSDRTKIMRPFDQDRAGIVSGEGSAMFVLESTDHVRGRGGVPLAWVLGHRAMADAHHPSAPEASGKWEAAAMIAAQVRSGLADGELVDAVYAHGTATPKGDAAEIRAINTVFEGRHRPLYVTSIKGHTGHTGAASGAMSMVAAIEGMKRGVVLPTLGTTKPDSEAKFEVVMSRPTSADLSVIQVNSFGFGGQNSSLVLQRAGDGDVQRARIVSGFAATAERS